MKLLRSIHSRPFAVRVEQTCLRPGQVYTAKIHPGTNFRYLPCYCYCQCCWCFSSISSTFSWTRHSIGIITINIIFFLNSRPLCMPREPFDGPVLGTGCILGKPAEDCSLNSLWERVTGPLWNDPGTRRNDPHTFQPKYTRRFPVSIETRQQWWGP